VAAIYIVTVPTPIGKYLRPGLTPLVKASETVGRVLNAGEIVVYASIVYLFCSRRKWKSG
jgi:UDP-N-acetyl-D-mannosaminuronate dehydrogenase